MSVRRILRILLGLLSHGGTFCPALVARRLPIGFSPFDWAKTLGANSAAAAAKAKTEWFSFIMVPSDAM
jgi:hypothetical protein